jgi:hypothetical protein
MPTVEPDTLLTAADLASRLGVKPETILDWHRKGRIPARKLSHKILRFELAPVLSALESPHAPRPEADGQAVEQGKAVSR